MKLKLMNILQDLSAVSLLINALIQAIISVIDPFAKFSLRRSQRNPEPNPRYSNNNVAVALDENSSLRSRIGALRDEGNYSRLIF